MGISRRTAGRGAVVAIFSTVATFAGAGAGAAITVHGDHSGSSSVGRTVPLLAGNVQPHMTSAELLQKAAAGNPEMGTLSDTFPGTSLNGALWHAYGTVALAGGIVTLTDVGRTAQYSGIKSLAQYDLTDSQLEAQLVSAGAQADSTQACLHVVDSGEKNSLTFMVTGGKLEAQQQVAGTYSTLASAAYSAGSMAWLRIREAAGTTYFEYSSDAKTWTALWSGADPITETALNAVIQQGMRSATDPQTSSRWAMVNPIAAILLSHQHGLDLPWDVQPAGQRIQQHRAARYHLRQRDQPGRLHGGRLVPQCGRRWGAGRRSGHVLR